MEEIIIRGLGFCLLYSGFPQGQGQGGGSEGRPLRASHFFFRLDLRECHLFVCDHGRLLTTTTSLYPSAGSRGSYVVCWALVSS